MKRRNIMKAIIRNVEATEYNKNAIAYAQTIDFAPLFDHLKAFAKIDCEFQTPEIYTSRCGDVHVDFTSDNIVPQTGPFSVILESCVLASFSNYVVTDKVTGELRYWVSVSVRYSHLDGGSNGMELCMAEYRDNTWTFRNAGSK